MGNLKYAGRIITDTGERMPDEIPGIKSLHLLKVNETRLEDFFSVDCSWYWSATKPAVVVPSNTADVNRVIGLVGANPEDPHDLGGSFSIRINDETHVLNKSCLIFVPAGVKFGPVRIEYMQHPAFFVEISPRPGSQKFTQVEQLAFKYAIITETKDKTNPPPPNPNLKGARILHMEDDMVKGSFYVDFVWEYRGHGECPAPEHHHDWVELIAMAGADPQNPHAIGGTMNIDLDGETYWIKNSSLVCIPANVKHCPWRFVEVNKPTLLFTAGISSQYYSSNKEQW